MPSADCDQESGFHRIQHQFRNFESEILSSFTSQEGFAGGAAAEKTTT